MGAARGLVHVDVLTGMLDHFFRGDAEDLTISVSSAAKKSSTEKECVNLSWSSKKEHALTLNEACYPQLIKAHLEAGYDKTITYLNVDWSHAKKATHVAISVSFKFA